jgi:hypothetical protein
MNDPVKGCDLYKNEGCCHVDGILCDYPKCSMLKEYIELHEEMEPRQRGTINKSE